MHPPPTDVAGLQRSFRLRHRVCFVWLPLPAPGVELRACIRWVPDRPSSLNAADRRQFLKLFKAALGDMADELMAEARRQRLLLDPDPVADHDRGAPQFHPGDPRAGDDDDDDDDASAETVSALH